MSKFSVDEISDLLKYSKKENLKYLDNILKIKNISNFDVNLVMSRLDLNADIIKLINLALEKYDSTDICKYASFDDYFYRILLNLETLENISDNLLNDLNERKTKYILKGIISGAIKFFKAENSTEFNGDFHFSKVL